MREIKFRAWDKKEKRYWSQKEMNEIGGYYYNYGVSNGEDLDDDFNPYEPYVLEQYTGLKDSKGVEIYEGDIVLVEDTYTDAVLEYGQGPKYPENHLSKVIFKNGSFGADIKESGDLYYAKFASFENIDATTGLGIIEVLGNIHENQELLDD